MIAYDIDGIFINDFDISKINLESYLKIRNFAKPLFIPQGKYCLITGRPIVDKEQTIQWINYYFSKNLPCKIYLGSQNLNESVQYKLNILTTGNINIFIESDLEQVKYLKKHTNKTILLFSDLILNILPYEL